MRSDDKPSEETKKAWKKDPTLWKWRMFYFNPADKRIFPPKQIGFLGWTINFANPLSILSIPVLIALIYLIAVLANGRLDMDNCE